MEFHKIAALFPLLDEASLMELVADIRANGQQYPIITFEGKILDGRNRYTACKLAGIEPEFEAFEGTKADALKAVWSWNVTRRHLGSDQIAVALGLRMKMDAEFAAEVEAIKAEQPKGGRPKQDQKPRQNFAEVSADERKTDHKLAETAGTNRTYLAQARKLIDAAPDVAQEVLDGKKKLHAAVKEVLPPPKKDPPPFDVDSESLRLADKVLALVNVFPEKHRRSGALTVISLLEQKYVS